ncbi:hypothetical protein BDV24DRAFT_144752 [Aspergillus arachidicola]|uniref:Uncharacterized protein n=1 Tax=Aspergillus arachidicola TaxID=656916 RepID=A0A5N6XQI3_9EURO|nr:hypothetical protein BDV24DRAFT_144752 [Aspergillus arachidicola]
MRMALTWSCTTRVGYQRAYVTWKLTLASLCARRTLLLPKTRTSKRPLRYTPCSLTAKPVTHRYVLAVCWQKVLRIPCRMR